MARNDDPLASLRTALDELAEQDVAELLAQARAEATARARDALADAMTASLLAAAERELSPGPRSPRPASPPAPPRRQAPEDPSPPADVPTGTAWYVYCVTSSAEPELPAGLAGIDSQHPVSGLVAGDLQAVVSQVPLAEFDEQRMREHLSDMIWVERVARRHEEVLEAVAAGRTIVPMRMCTLYRDEHRLRTMLEHEASVMQAALDDLRGRAEWGVKVFAGSGPGPGSGAEPEPPASGADYLQRRRREHEERGLEHERLSEAADAIFGRLEERAVRAAAIPLQRPEVSGHRGEMILNSVYLVEEADLPVFHAEVATLQEEFATLGLELRATGPWPAYNFVPDAIGMAS